MTDEQRAAEAAACPYCRAKAEREREVELQYAEAQIRQDRIALNIVLDVLHERNDALTESEGECAQLRAELRAAVDALRKIANVRHDYPGDAFWFMRETARTAIAAYDAKHPEGA